MKDSGREALEVGDTPPTSDTDGAPLTVGSTEVTEEALEVTVALSLRSAEGVKREVMEWAAEVVPAADNVPTADALPLPEEEEHPELEGEAPEEEVYRVLAVDEGLALGVPLPLPVTEGDGVPKLDALPVTDPVPDHVPPPDTVGPALVGEAVKLPPALPVPEGVNVEVVVELTDTTADPEGIPGVPVEVVDPLCVPLPPAKLPEAVKVGALPLPLPLALKVGKGVAQEEGVAEAEPVVAPLAEVVGVSLPEETPRREGEAVWQRESRGVMVTPRLKEGEGLTTDDPVGPNAMVGVTSPLPLPANPGVGETPPLPLLARLPVVDGDTPEVPVLVPKRGVRVALTLPFSALPLTVGVAEWVPLGEPVSELQEVLLLEGTCGLGVAVSGSTVLDTVVVAVSTPLGVLPLPPECVGRADWDSDREGVGEMEAEGLWVCKGVGVLVGVPMEDPLPMGVPVEEGEDTGVAVLVTLPRLVREVVEEAV